MNCLDIIKREYPEISELLIFNAKKVLSNQLSLPFTETYAPKSIGENNIDVSASKEADTNVDVSGPKEPDTFQEGGGSQPGTSVPGSQSGTKVPDAPELSSPSAALPESQENIKKHFYELKSVIPGPKVPITLTKEECINWVSQAKKFETGFLPLLTAAEKEEWKRVKEKVRQAMRKW